MEEQNNNELKTNSEIQQTNEQPIMKKKKSKLVPTLVAIIVVLLLALALCIGNMYALMNDYDNLFAMAASMMSGEEVSNDDNIATENNGSVSDSENDLDGSEEINDDEEKNDLIPNLNFGFLQLENEEQNKIYSPLSIKYALKMLEEGTSGNSKTQISKVIGNYALKKYNSNSNMSLANALFVRDTFKSGINENYINTLLTKYNAEVIFDSFSSAKNVNTWVSDKTLNLIDNMLSDIDKENDFLLINALGIDMEWKENFLKMGCEWVSYEHEDFHWSGTEQVSSHKFNEKEQLVSGMEITASINNYDIVTELGEENIRKTVGDEFRKWAKSLTEDDWEYNDTFDGDLSDENIEKKLEQYIDGRKILW